jgi:hypothetical protein
MTTVAETSVEAKDAAVKARKVDMDAREKTLNASKTGKGTRTFLAMTRGRNPQEIQYENWDDSLPDSLPTTLSECMSLITEKESEIVRRIILGDNDVRYAEASDPVSEYVDATWDADVQARFKVTIRNFARDSNLSIEDAVAIIKPSVIASQAKK